MSEPARQPSSNRPESIGLAESRNVEDSTETAHQRRPFRIGIFFRRWKDGVLVTDFEFPRVRPRKELPSKPYPGSPDEQNTQRPRNDPAAGGGGNAGPTEVGGAELRPRSDNARTSGGDVGPIEGNRTEIGLFTSS